MQIEVNQNFVKIKEREIINRGEYKIHTLLFNFSEEYDGLVLKAVFSSINGSYTMSIIDNKCEIPYEMLKEVGNVELGVYAYDLVDEELKLRYSPMPDCFCVEKGSYKEGSQPTPPTPSEYEQYLKAYNDNAVEKTNELQELTTELEQGLNEVAEQGVSTITETYEEKTAELEEKIASGEYNGATFTPNVDNDGNISWSNDKDLPNPETKNIRGPQGEQGPVGPAGAVRVLVVDDLPETGEEGVLYFVRKEDATETDLYDEYMYIDNQWEYLGTRTIEIDLKDYVKNTDYATNTKGGVIRTNIGYGSNMRSDGILLGAIRTLEQYNSGSDLTIIAKGTLENVLNDRIGNIETLLERLDVGGGV